MNTDIAMETLWGIAAFGQGELLPLSHDDIQADTAAAARALQALGTGAETGVVLVSTFPEMGFFWPFHAACIESGRLLTTVDATTFDAGRLEVLLRRFPADLVIGVNAAVLEGLRMFGFDVATVFRPARLTVARYDALELLASAGVPAVPWIELGPALGIGCREGAVHVDSEEWAVESVNGEFRVSSRRPRALPVQDFVTGVHGVMGGTSCGCGRTDQIVSVTG